MDFETLARHLPRDTYEWVCLQQVLKPEDAQSFAARGDVQFFGNELNGFEDTAALCAHMDVVVSVDTSVAHLAAALGKPTWVLLPFAPDWRWLLNREDSPWYDSVRLFRQDEDRQWSPVLERVMAQLPQTLGAA